MRLLSQCAVQYGVVAPCPSSLQNSDIISYLEYRIDKLDDLRKLKDVDRMCVAHAPDPQHEDWIEIIGELSRLEHVKKINSHARSEDFYLLCDRCGVRLVNTRMKNQICDHCDNFF